MRSSSSSTASGPISPATISRKPSRSIMGAIADMAPRADRAQALRKRFISAAILLPVAAAAVWLGSHYWDGLVGVFALAMAWEWSRMCAADRALRRGAVFGIAPAGLFSM